MSAAAVSSSAKAKQPMSERRRRAWWIGTVALVIGLLVAAFLYTHERVDVQRPLPMGAEARANPLHALTLALRDAGQSVVLKGHLDLERAPPPARGSIVLLYPEAQIDTPDLAWALGDWVDAGGRLALPMPRGDAAPALTELLRDGFGVEALRGVAAVDDCPTLAVGDGLTPQYVCGVPFTVRGTIDEALVWPNAKAARFARLPHGDGEVLLFADLGLLENWHFLPLGSGGDAAADAKAKVERDARAALSARLAGPLLDGDEVWIVAFQGGSLTALIFSRGWPLLLGLGLALLAWLLLASARFGPLVPTPPAHRRALLEHLDAAGQFAFRSDHGLALHAALRDAVLDRLAKRHALARLDHSTLAAALADRSRLPRESIASALELPPRAAPEAFRDAIATLSAVLQKL